MWRRRSRAAQAAWCADRLGSSDSPVTVVQNRSAPRIADEVEIVGPHLQVRCRRLPVEVEREVIRGEDLAEGDRRRVLGVDHDVPVVDTEVAQGAAHEAAERVVADPGDQRHGVAEAGGRDRDVGRTAAEELAERVDVLEPDARLQWVDVDPATAEGQDLLGVRHVGPPSFHHVRVGGARGLRRAFANCAPRHKPVSTVCPDIGAYACSVDLLPQCDECASADPSAIIRRRGARRTTWYEAVPARGGPLWHPC